VTGAKVLSRLKNVSCDQGEKCGVSVFPPAGASWLPLTSPNLEVVPLTDLDRAAFSEACDAFLACRLRKEASVVLDVLGLRRLASGSARATEVVERREVRLWCTVVVEGYEVLERGRLEVVLFPGDKVEEDDGAGADRVSKIL